MEELYGFDEVQTRRVKTMLDAFEAGRFNPALAQRKQDLPGPQWTLLGLTDEAIPAAVGDEPGTGTVSRWGIDLETEEAYDTDLDVEARNPTAVAIAADSWVCLFRDPHSGQYLAVPMAGDGACEVEPDLLTVYASSTTYPADGYFNIAAPSTGRLMIAGVRRVAGTFGAPSGWTTIFNVGTYWAGYRVATPEDQPAGYSWTFTSCSSFTFNFVVFPAGAQVEAVASSTGTGTTITMPSVTSGGANRYLVFAQMIQSSVGFPVSDPAGMTILDDTPVALGGGTNGFIQMYGQNVGVGPTGTRTCTQSTSQTWAAAAVLVKPADSLTGSTVSGDVVACGRVVAAATPAQARYALGVNSAVPASASASGVAGEFAYDSSYFYVCTATNTWKRVAIATW